MKCPKCKKEMQKVPLSPGVVVYICWTCQVTKESEQPLPKYKLKDGVYDESGGEIPSIESEDE